jgi:large subunit ribosomal protein L13
MPTTTATTRSAKREDMEQQRQWYVIDATNLPMGRLAAEAAKILRGKNKPQWTPHVDCGDHVIIINAEKVRLTGTSKKDEPLYRHTLYPGGLRTVSRGRELEKDPSAALLRVIKGMLPHNSLGAAVLKKLRVYAGAEHPHQAQNPVTL